MKRSHDCCPSGGDSSRLPCLKGGIRPATATSERGYLHLLGDSGAGRRIYAGLIEEYPDNRSYRRNDAFIAAAQGDAQAGRDFIRWMERPDSPYSAEAVIRERALQEAALGNLDEAMRLLRQVVEPGTEPSTLRTAAYEWFWDHPGFQELMRPRG